MAKTEPISLVDVLPQTETVDVGGGKTIEVRGAAVRHFVDLFKRFPPIQGVMVGRGIEVAAIIDLGPDVVAALIAIACGKQGDPAFEAATDNLTLETQMDILEAMGRMTFTRGFGPFRSRVRAAVEALSAEDGRGPAMNSPRPSPSSRPTNTRTSSTSPPASASPGSS